MSVHACVRLAQLGPLVRESGLDAEGLSIPWNRLIVGAAQCESGRRDGSVKGREKEVKYGDDVPREPDPDSFLITDLPGFGFAEVPEKQRIAWAQFMRQYRKERNTLRVVFHLVDSRHGPTDEDKRIMQQVSDNLPAKANYVIVLTKADKNVKGAPGKVSDAVMQSLRNAMNESGVGKRPVILTSANTKLGRDDLWRYLRTERGSCLVVTDNIKRCISPASGQC